MGGCLLTKMRSSRVGKECVQIVDKVYWISVPIVISSLMLPKLTRKTRVNLVDKNCQMRMANLIQRKSSKSKRMVHYAKYVDAADGSVKHVPNENKNMTPTKMLPMKRKSQNTASQKIQTIKMPTKRKVAKRHLKQVSVAGVREEGQTLIADSA